MGAACSKIPFRALLALLTEVNMALLSICQHSLFFSNTQTQQHTPCIASLLQKCAIDHGRQVVLAPWVKPEGTDTGGNQMSAEQGRGLVQRGNYRMMPCVCVSFCSSLSVAAERNTDASFCNFIATLIPLQSVPQCVPWLPS